METCIFLLLFCLPLLYWSFFGSMFIDGVKCLCSVPVFHRWSQKHALKSSLLFRLPKTPNLSYVKFLQPPGITSKPFFSHKWSLQPAFKTPKLYSICWYLINQMFLYYLLSKVVLTSFINIWNTYILQSMCLVKKKEISGFWGQGDRIIAFSI